MCIASVKLRNILCKSDIIGLFVLVGCSVKSGSQEEGKFHESVKVCTKIHKEVCQLFM